MMVPDILRTAKLFTDLPKAAQEALLQTMQPREFAPEEWIVREGEAGDSLFVVTAGVVSVLKQCGAVMLELLDLLRPGEMFGEMSLFLSAPRSASVQAVLPTTCYVLEFSRFEDFVAHHPKAGQHLYRHCIAELAERLRSATERLEQTHTRQALRIADPAEAIPSGVAPDFGARLAVIQGMGELLATAPLSAPEQQRCRTMLAEQLAALQQQMIA